MQYIYRNITYVCMYMYVSCLLKYPPPLCPILLVYTFNSVTWSPSSVAAEEEEAEKDEGEEVVLWYRERKTKYGNPIHSCIFCQISLPTLTDSSPPIAHGVYDAHVFSLL